MPPPLHPRSRQTTSLFTTTLAISFLVVALPHLLPCPAAPLNQLADSPANSPTNARRRRARRALEDDAVQETEQQIAQERPRQCPVPKPGGLVGEVLGFNKERREMAMDDVKVVRIEERPRN